MFWPTGPTEDDSGWTHPSDNELSPEELAKNKMEEKMDDEDWSASKRNAHWANQKILAREKAAADLKKKQAATKARRAKMWAAQRARIERIKADRARKAKLMKAAKKGDLGAASADALGAKFGRNEKYGPLPK